MLVYNKITTVLGGNGIPESKLSDQRDLVALNPHLLPGTADSQDNIKCLEKLNEEQPPSSTNKSKEDAIWYEYGCV